MTSRRSPARWALVLGTAAALAAALGTAARGAGGLPAPGTLVYWSDRPRPALWRVDPTGAPRALAPTGQNAKRPRLSPDRRSIAFDGTPAPKRPMSDFDVQLVRLDGGGRRTLTHGPQWDIDAQWSPDGLLLAFQRMPPGAVWQKAWTWTIRPDGRGLRRLTRGGGARWSPDGTRLAVHRPTATSEADLFVVDRTGRHARLLLASPEIDQPADWSPDGRLVLFTRYTEDGGTEVRLVGADGRGERKVATGTAGSFSPDGHWLVYTDARTGRLAVVRPDGSGRRVLARLVGLDPHWG